jgi:hypothetical protein
MIRVRPRSKTLPARLIREKHTAFSLLDTQDPRSTNLFIAAFRFRARNGKVRQISDKTRLNVAAKIVGNLELETLRKSPHLSL